MAKKSENPAVETEKGFGTGLRVKLERRQPDTPEPAQAPLPEQEPELEPVAEAEHDEPELSETEQLWAELEESLAREEQLKRTLDEQAKAYEETRELSRRLEKRADALRQREQQLAEQVKALEGVDSPEEPAAPTEHGRLYLRRRIEDSGDMLWRVFQEALTATSTDGRPDFQTRLFAASTLLAEAYGDLAGMSPGERVAAARDELAGMRAKRAAKPKKR